jgi:hypothetical protein
MLARNLVQLPRVTDLFGKRGRELLAGVETTILRCAEGRG